MMTFLIDTAQKKSPRAEAEGARECSNDRVQSTTKIETIREALRRPGGLNRFEAERYGDHCLNSTVADLRKLGEMINSQWEVVPTRFNPKGVRVLRYWSTGIVGGVRNGR